MCLELWLRVPEEEEVQEALGLAATLMPDTLAIRPEVRIHEGYVTPPECFCSFSCLTTYAAMKWQQSDLLKEVARDSNGWQPYPL